MTNTCILISLYFDKNIGLSTPNLPTPPNTNDVPCRILHRIDRELCLEWEYQPQHAKFRHCLSEYKTRKDDSPVR